MNWAISNLRQHNLTSFLKTLVVGQAGVWTPTSWLADQYSHNWANQAAFMYMSPTVSPTVTSTTSANLSLNEVHDRVFYLSPLSRMLSLSIKSSLLFFPLLGVTLRCKKRDCHELGTSKLTLKLDMSHFVTVKLLKKALKYFGTVWQPVQLKIS